MPITRTNVVVANRVRSTPWQSIADFCSAVIAAMTTNAVVFPAPPYPLASFTVDVADFQSNIDAWGALGNRGSHADWVNVVASSIQCLNDLEAEAGYVQAIARGSFPGNYASQVATVLLAAMRAKDDSNRLAAWGVVNAFEQLIKPSLQNTGNVYLRWKKPNVLPGAMSKPPAYNVYISPDNITYTFLGATSSTFFVDHPGTGNMKYYKVAPVSSAGEGALSTAIQGYGQ